MKTRSPAEVGECIRLRRAELGLSQSAIEGISAAALRKIEAGNAPTPRDSTRIALMRGLDWADDALDRLADGVDPVEVRRTIHMSASGTDLEQLRIEDPEAYAALEELGRIALARARARSGT